MKTLGIIGGIGPESTIEYYRKSVNIYRNQTQDGSYPPIHINSINMTQMLDLIGAGELDAVTQYLLGEINQLVKANVDVGLLASNTPHIVFEALSEQSPIPLISIVDVTCQAVATQGLARLGLLGTRFTMQGGFYQRVFSEQNIDVITPEAAEQNFVHGKYMGELVNGVTLPETRSAITKIIDRMMDEDHIQGIILGGTELPLLFTETTYRHMPFFDTTTIHVESAVAHILS